MRVDTLALVWPELSCTLVDSHASFAAFLAIEQQQQQQQQQ